MTTTSLEDAITEFRDITARIKEGEAHIAATKRAHKAAVEEELQEYVDRVAQWKDRKTTLVARLMPHYLDMAERHGVSSFGGIQLRRGKTPQVVLPEERTDAYRQLARGLLPYTWRGEPLVEFRIKHRALQAWLEHNGFEPAHDLGLDLVYTDTLAMDGDL